MNRDGSSKFSTIRVVNFEYGDRIVIHPNPITDRINIKGLSGNETIVIYNNIGKTIYKQTITSKEVILPADHLQTGIYNIQVINTDGTSVSFKVIKNL